MRTTITAMPTEPPPATTPAGAGWLKAVWDQVTGDRALIYIGLALSVAALVYLVRRARKVARSERPDDTLATLGMLIGLGWSGEAMWVIGTQKLHVPVPLLVLLLLVLEVNLAVAMMRAKRHHRDEGHPGSYGTTAWVIAGSMALIAAFASHSIAEAALRVAIPLLVTKTWWDGMVGAGAKRLTGSISWRWTPRRLLLWLGAIEPGEKDVETVHRDRLTQQMTQLEFRRRYGNDRTQERSAKKLARLSLTADEAIIAEVRQRVSRASWFTVIPLPPQPLTQPADGSTGTPASAVAKVRDAAVTIPPMRRSKPVTRPATSGDARGADPATRAAQLFLTQQVDSIREAARRVPGASEATVRRRVNEARDAASGASPDAPDLPISEPKQPVTAGVNGHHPTTPEGA
ncbi:hypothetical protein [Actinoplanes sp. URMC 104]|uniref:hypothetical protein n=1 Tax=Actinoplanes sp. URMC 104 TaxID=3423409 RepID=UPI003F1C5EDE